ncbi:major facilitator superfamily domain-containing protein [Gongronella butleri]|nr:major facilitator superfamily domain-containing protein [Gongronella butleri]
MEKVDRSSVHEYASVEEPTSTIISPAEKKLRRKIMLVVLPLVWASIFVNFVDKAMLSVAAVNGLLKDTQITPDQYSWVSSIIYLGYLVYQLPNNILIQRVPLGKYLGALLLLWGASVLATAFTHNFAQLMVTRFILGLFESGAYPVIYILLNRLFRRSEQPFVYAFMMASSGTGTIVGTVIGYSLTLTMNGKVFGNLGPWNAWRWGYFIYGIVTMFIGILVSIFLTDNPYSKWFRLSEDEKKIVAERVKDNMVARTHKIKRSQIWEAAKEFRFWANNITYFLLSMQNAGMVAYSVLLVQSLGFSSVQSTLLQIPSGALAAVFALIASLLIRITGQRIYVCCLCMFIAIIGFIILLTNKTIAGQLAGYYVSWAYVGAMATQLNIVGSNVGGYSKKIMYNGSYVVFGTLGSFVGPQIMKSDNYIGGYIGFIAGNAVGVILLLLIRWQMARVNNKRLANPVPPPALDEDGQMPDLTDVENNAYIYKL